MEYYIKRLYRFLEKLSQNNDREWFRANRAEYDELRSLWMEDLDRLILLMAKEIPALARQNAKSCAFRIYRDTRFSTDKRPFKDYFSATINPEGRKPHGAGYYLQMGPHEDNGLYGGIWCPDSKTLNTLRREIVANIEEFEEALSNPEIEKLFPSWCGTSLKTAPKGWDKNHPQIELLRLKEYGKFNPCKPEFFLDPSWPEISAERLLLLKPFVDFLDYSISYSAE